MKKIIASTLFATLLACVFLVEAPQDAEAGGCRTAYYSYPNSSYCYPSYEPTYIYRDVVREVPVAYPVPFTVAVPVVSYLYNGGGYSYAPVFQAQPSNGMGTVSQVQQPAPTQATASDPSQFTDAQIDNLITRIEQRLAAKQQQPKNGNGNGHSNGTNGKTATAPPPPAAPSDVTTILMLKRGNDQKSCMDCHTGSSAKGSVKIFLEPGKLNPAADWSAIWDAADTGAMPPEVKKNRNAALSDQEVEVLRAKMLEANKGKK